MAAKRKTTRRLRRNGKDDCIEYAPPVFSGGYLRPADAGKSYAYKWTSGPAKRSGGGFGLHDWAAVMPFLEKKFADVAKSVVLVPGIDKDGPYWRVDVHNRHAKR